ncbi:MAG: GIY-YIG nuclease family protein [Alphaproteobacteria bacterium]|nr:GIY-YIG nuclease family protein [Alphaproteobacteria bacterium]
MKYVCLLQSISNPRQTYTGLTDDLSNRLREHNSGETADARKYLPWRLVTYLAFPDHQKAVAFERYLKTASGRAFANKRLR